MYAPLYYSSFKCIADKCRHSCCIGWEIDVDGDSLEKYEGSSEKYAGNIRESIDYSGSPHFKLCEGDKCPHLNGNGLCRIILEIGEDYLCHICREHPRFYNETSRGKEVGLGLVCEEACRIILTSDNYESFITLGEIETADCCAEFDACYPRAEIYSILSNRTLPYSKRLSMISKKYSVSPSSIPDEDWKELLASLEYLNENDRTLFSSYSSLVQSPKSIENYLERALAYFIYRHASPAEDEADFRASIGLALFFERLLCSAVVSVGDFRESAIFDIARRLSEELEYSEENTEAIKFEFEFIL